MLVRLTSSTSGELIMFAEHAHALFAWIGKETTAHGVFTTEQLPEAIACLRHGVEEEKAAAKRLAEEKRANAGSNGNKEHDNDEKGGGEKEKEPQEIVSLGHRAQPLINLMQWTLKEDGFIIWEASQDF
ncbi:MAG: DUF1840 domain-containing protein [Propionivibrio sp.]